MKSEIEFVLIENKNTNSRMKIGEEPQTDLESMWDRLVCVAPSSTFFHSLQWLRSVQALQGQGIRIYIVVSGDIGSCGSVVAHRKHLGLAIGNKPWATFYNGPIFEGQPAVSDMNLLSSRLQNDFASFRFVSPRITGEHEMWNTNHMRPNVNRTALLDCTELDNLYGSFDRRVRQRIRKATNLGVTVQEMTDFGIFFDLYKMTYERQQLEMPIRREQMVGLLTTANQSENFEVFQAKTSAGDPAAALAVGSDRKRAYFVLAASHPEHRKTDAMTLLWWEIIQEYAKRFDEIDLVGLGTPGIERFKRSFSPRIVDVPDITYYSSRSSRAIVETAQWLTSRYRMRFKSSHVTSSEHE